MPFAKSVAAVAALALPKVAAHTHAAHLELKSLQNRVARHNLSHVCVCVLCARICTITPGDRHFSAPHQAMHVFEGATGANSAEASSCDRN